MKPERAATDHILALTLKAGAYTAFALIVAGVVLQLVAPFGRKVTVAGVIVLLATPMLRIIVAGIQFLRERDMKYVLVSLGVLCIVVLAYFLGIQA
jgi:uncharacterized membrane protein